jgi:hypothetical protein
MCIISMLNTGRSLCSTQQAIAYVVVITSEGGYESFHRQLRTMNIKGWPDKVARRFSLMSLGSHNLNLGTLDHAIFSVSRQKSLIRREDI